MKLLKGDYHVRIHTTNNPSKATEIHPKHSGKIQEKKCLFFFLFYFIFKLYIIVLVLPNIKMNPPQVYMCSPSWTLLPSPGDLPDLGIKLESPALQADSLPSESPGKPAEKAFKCHCIWEGFTIYPVSIALPSFFFFFFTKFTTSWCYITCLFFLVYQLALPSAEQNLWKPVVLFTTVFLGPRPNRSQSRCQRPSAERSKCRADIRKQY